ncbi:MAG: hypothetical protein Q3997_08750, partial [Propionibacteriaceae bacterium]|nr:hypothetical protein [Propionibacteriaceae bacterium]
MAGWQDGAEYAPIERPDAFAAPAVEALPVAAPYAADTPGAVRPPQVMRPPTSAIPLESLVPAEASVRRDPRAPFSVVSAIMTSDSAWGAAHRADQPGWAPEFDPTRPMGRVEATFPPPGPSVQAPAAGAPSWPARPADPWAPPGPPPHPGQFRQGPPFH